MLITIPDHLHSITIQQLQLPNRIRNILLRANIWNLGELIPYLNNLSIVHGLGVSTVPIITSSVENLCNSIDENHNIDWNRYWVLQKIDPENVQESNPFSRESNILSRKITISENFIHITIDELHLPEIIYNKLNDMNIITLLDLYNAQENGTLRENKLDNRYIKKINGVIENIKNSIDKDNKIDWNKYFNKQGLIIIPQQYNPVNTSLNIFYFLEETIKFILNISNDERHWEIIQHRFGLKKTNKFTLEELGSFFGITRERVRQIEFKCLKKLRLVLTEKEHIEYPYIIHPNILFMIRSILKIFNKRENMIITENDLFKKIEFILSCSNANNPIIHLLLKLAEMNPIHLINTDLIPVWQHSSLANQDLTQTIITNLDILLTQDIIIPMEDFEILLKINQKLPKNQKISLVELHQYIKLCSTIEQRDDGLFWGKFEYLKSRGDQAYRILTEAGKPLSIGSMTRTINSTLIPHGHQKLQEQNFANQLISDARFIPIGRTGQWALKAWNHIDTSSILELMEKFLHIHNKPATDQEIFDYVQQRRPVGRGSINIYLTSNPKIFRKTSRSHWGLATWKETENAHIWNREQIADFIANIFKQHKTQKLELRIIREALMHAARVTSRQAIGMVARNPALRIYHDPNTTIRFATFQPNYKAEINTKQSITRKKQTIRDSIQQAVHLLLEQSPNKQMPLFQLIKQLTSAPYNFHDKTMYAYIRQMSSVETIIIPETGTKMCRLKGTDSITFPQVNRIQDSQLRDNINHALTNLNETNIDIALFQLGREFEATIKNCLISGIISGRINASQSLGKDPKKWKLVDMVDYAKNQNLIIDLGAVNLLCQERNNPAQGLRPTLSERQALMNSAPYLAGLYIDYIIHFSELMDTF
ncbi:sigma factor-like helix-turn-helix DNA-binding protein [Herpetosiphon gulosus]|uniref:RNA polymerase sigma factor RpoD n=1 Tax=Herpetosiphon gulosus TaxID=1973496 RepID=A0ABP9X4D3_9CHLR